MSAIVLVLVIASTLAVGAVRPWAYFPLFACAAMLGAACLVRRPKILALRRAIALGTLCVALAIGVQLVPVSRETLDAVSPHAASLLSRYAVGWTGAHALSVNPPATILALIGLVALGLYLIGLSGTLSAQALRALPRNLMFFAVPLALFGIFSRQHGNGLIYWFWRPPHGGGGDAAGPFVNRNHFAGWMLMASCLVIGHLLGSLERDRRDGRTDWRSVTLWFSSREANTLVLTTVSVTLMAISLVWTMSRSGISAFVVAIVLFVFLRLARERAGVNRRAGALAILGLVLLAAVTWRGATVLSTWFGDTRDVLSRFDVWQEGWGLVKDFPLAGTGLNTYSTAMLFYQTHNLDTFMAQAHNDYLQLAVEGGLLVAIPAAITMACLAVAVRRNLRAASHESRGYWIRAGAAVGLMAIAVQEVAEFSLQMPANAFLFCTLAAVALAPVGGRATTAQARTL